ncbi:MAG TPA: cupin domain-containing protein [Balneolales bacterium]|jgi:predicted cupin superfamily sugar epimerase|nr:cupin domain-containing protein [Balneolales bacterium]
MPSAEFWKEKLNLDAHPEGGYYREIYRSGDTIARAGLPPRYPGDRSAATLIYYLLKDDDFSAFHRIRSDEIWIYVAGDSLDIHAIRPDGSYKIERLGKNIVEGSSPVRIIEHGSWFGASLPFHSSFCLCTCMVSPGFDFADFEMADPGILKNIHPEHAQIIDKLSR